MATLSKGKIALMQRYWQAANYLSAAQIYLQANPLLKEPLRPEHIKPRLLGHWGTCPGLNLIYVHLNRLIQDTNANILFIAGPGHGAPAVVANIYLEGTYSAIYPEVSQDEEGMAKLFRQFSSPGGIPSHVSADIPGSIHEGGELGYCLAHAAGAVFDNPDLIAACVVGDGEAETGPLEGSWKSIKFLNPQRDGAILPFLHLNGYKISSATVMARMKNEELQSLLEGYGYTVLFVEGDEPEKIHFSLAEALDKAYEQIISIQQEARNGKEYLHLRWPLIVLRTPKGWTGPVAWQGKKIEGTFHSHQVPLTEVIKYPEQLKLLEQWLRSYDPENLFDIEGQLFTELAALIPTEEKRMGTNPHANAGHVLKDLILPSPEKYAVEVASPGTIEVQSTRELGKYIRDIFWLNKANDNFRLFCPDETESNRLQAVFEATNRFYLGEIKETDEHLSADGRVMEVLSEHLCQGWMEGYLLTGRHGLFSCYEAFITIIDSMFNQYAKWIKTCQELPWRHPLSSFNYLLTSHTWRQDHNGYSHQGPGFIDTVVNKKSHIIRIYFPPDANCLLCIMHRCLASKNDINLVVAGKQPQLQWLNMEQAKEHCRKGVSVWQWAGNDNDNEPDIILACAGDVPTMETVAAAWLLKQHLPELKVRVVNVVDLMCLPPAMHHPHGISEDEFAAIFTDTTDVVFAFHGYVRIIHDLVHGRPEPERFHVRGFMEEGTTTTPFDMTVLNNISRYQLAIEAIFRSGKSDSSHVVDLFEQKLKQHHHYIREHLDDMPEIKNWKWT
ncbi:phosphoketolase family protein [Terrimonas alba]|uniref:phosphoketolase family protein n=1 Tax=Terrimonas alba TaxID=3349636 RepID=UPI0035F2BB75